METLKVFLIEYLLGYGLQSFAVVLGVYTFNRQRIILKNYIIASGIITIISCLVRFLPISFGVHTIINILFIYLICVIPLKMPAYTTIRSASICIVLILLCEIVITGVMMVIIGKENFDNLLNDPFKKSLIGLLANLIFALLITLSYYKLMKKGDKNRKISS